MRRVSLLLVLGCFVAPVSLTGQHVHDEPAAERVTHVVGVGINGLSEPLAALLYMRRLEAVPLGWGVELARAGLLPQLQVRREGLLTSPSPGPPLFSQVNHLSLGVLFSPAGVELAGREVNAGSAAVLMLGSQLWPVEQQPIPVFLDLSAGVAVVLAGLEGRPGAMLMLRGHAGIGW